jgi:hypothetical protein
MLRAVLVVVGGVALVSALVAAICRAPFPLVMWLTVIGVVLTGGILFERERYKPAVPGHPGPGWVATNERFVDPQSGEIVTVYYQPSTGERRYIER